MSTPARNTELTILNGFEVEIEALTRMVDGSDVKAFPGEGIAWVPMDRLDQWVQGRSNTRTHCALLYDGVETEAIDETPHIRAEADRIKMGFFIIVPVVRIDERQSFEPTLRTLVDLVNRTRNAVETQAETLEANKVIAGTGAADYIAWDDRIEAPDEMSTDFLGDGYQFNVGRQYARGTADR